MMAYGYDFHQTTIAKIEAAQRPLRVRELADFAALYDVEVQDLVYPPTRSLLEIDQEIEELTGRLAVAEADEVRARRQLESARVAAEAAQAAYQASAAEVAVLESRLGSLSADREKARSWGPDGDSPLPVGSDKADQGALPATAAPIASMAGGPTVLRIIAGAQLRRLREAAGITADQAAGAIRASRSKIARLETGRTGFKGRDIADLLLLYGVTDEQERRALLALAQQANTPGWWHDYADLLPDWFETYIGLEMAASEMRVYENRIVPELLQTADYSRAATRLGYASASAEEADRRVRLRMARKEHFLGRLDPPRLRVVLDEAVLRRPVGAAAVMRDQITYLAEIAEQPNVTIQVLPFQADGHSAEGSFSILRFAEPELPDVVYIEQLTSALYLDRREEVGVYLGVMDGLANRALAPHRTTQFLRDLLLERAPQ
jgi:transcriptional regulator with XRE-family HTH domain